MSAASRKLPVLSVLILMMFASRLALGVPTLQTSVVPGGDPALPDAPFDVLVSLTNNTTTYSLELLFFKVNYDESKVQLTGVSSDPTGFLLDTVFDPFIPAGVDPGSPLTFRAVAAGDLGGSNTLAHNPSPLTNGPALILHFQTAAVLASKFDITISQADPTHEPLEAELPFYLQNVDTGDPITPTEFAFDNTATMDLGPEGPDADSDGVLDTAEGDGSVPGQTNRVIADSDGDGLSDGQELARATNGRNRDTDGDLLGDGIEVLLGTNPLVANTGVVDDDSDGYPEAANDDGGNPLDFASTTLGSVDPNPASGDTDSDKYQDGYEAAFFKDGSAANDNARKPILGDVRSVAGVVNQFDAIVIVQVAFNRLTFDAPSVINQQAFDINRDGRITQVDALLAAQVGFNKVAFIPRTR